MLFNLPPCRKQSSPCHCLLLLLTLLTLMLSLFLCIAAGYLHNLQAPTPCLHLPSCRTPAEQLPVPPGYAVGPAFLHAPWCSALCGGPGKQQHRGCWLVYGPWGLSSADRLPFMQRLRGRHAQSFSDNSSCSICTATCRPECPLLTAAATYAWQPLDASAAAVILAAAAGCSTDTWVLFRC